MCLILIDDVEKKYHGGFFGVVLTVELRTWDLRKVQEERASWGHQGRQSTT